MFDNLLTLLEKPAPAPSVTVPVQTGGSPRIGVKHEQQLWLRFRFGWLATGSVAQKINFNIPITGAVTRKLSFRLPVTATVAKSIQFRYPAYGSMRTRFHIPVRGTVGKNSEDLTREIEDLKYIVSKKRKRANSY